MVRKSLTEATRFLQMNRKELPKLKWKRLKLRPIARRLDSSGIELEGVDDVWVVQDVSPEGLRLSNGRTDHNLLLKADHIHEYRSDPNSEEGGFLLLNSQIHLEARKVTVEPFHYRHSLKALSEAVETLENELDEALRLAKGAVIEGATPLSLYEVGKRSWIAVQSFGIRYEGRDSAVYYNSGSISGPWADVVCYVYAIDHRREGGAVAYFATVNRWEALAGHEKIYIGRIYMPKIEGV
ncbi:MAG: hypothetical protein ACYDA9_01025 [Terriglobia bacterium]